ncbi:hypothetical protein KVH02_21910 [Streptomyces olivaceus]|uniref:ATP-binding protein n=1 Tax=Streptomyces olivaceus TaxID=47716 RepID=A0ABS7W659_STROV|nr:hypothetical protein [Streptomyces olivaceus]MBZ6083470.1 hypothetical protein [Streptomyces olivaceus]MBZ6090957.1 hypothetical protein [Streptomyces olivaceus]MBZ6097132.1 hypothetical protein [Streptomyces olivaceus]MBZ6119331.1 hypothetical protein [Streptomyces olivaceus]MBZ6153457.1 hypothetical protein [Streptomyces olivaceus]
MTTASPRQDLGTRVADALSSQVLNAVVGIAGIAIPIAAWVAEKSLLRDVLLGAETVLLLLMVANHMWLRRIYIQLRRANDRHMADARYFALVRQQLERELIAGFGEIADGHLQVYASEVPRLSVLLFQALIDSGSEPKRVLAADLTTSPDLLTQRREYLAVNRRLIESGGTVQRLFICWQDDLARHDFARSLLALVDHHRSLGVQCALGVRDRLRADQAVDFVVVSKAAVLLEEEQGDTDYRRGRSSVYFKHVERWAGRFESIWGHGSDSAPFVLQSYEATARPMLDAGTWDDAAVREAASRL